MLSPTAALESRSIPASPALRRVAHAQFDDAVRAVREMPAPDPAPAPAYAAPAAPINVNLLRDQYADDRLHCAIEQYRSPGSLCGCEGADWGLIDCLLPAQPYRVALPNPPVELLGATAVPPTLRRLAVPRLEDIGLDDGFESARRRRRLPNWP